MQDDDLSAHSNDGLTRAVHQAFHGYPAVAPPTTTTSPIQENEQQQPQQQQHVSPIPPPQAWQSPQQYQGNITAAIPSLSALADADAHGQFDLTANVAGSLLNPGNITASIPGLADLVQQDEMSRYTSRHQGHGGDADYTGGTTVPLNMMPSSRPAPHLHHHQQQQQVVDWSRPAFVPPYMAPEPTTEDQKQQPSTGGPIQSHPGASYHSDHPALVHSPDVTNSSLNTLETRRVSVDTQRRASVASYRSHHHQQQQQQQNGLTGNITLGGTTGLLLTEGALQGHNNSMMNRRRSDGGQLHQQQQRQRGRRLSGLTDKLLDDEEEDLLADDGNDDVAPPPAVVGAAPHSAASQQQRQAQGADGGPGMLDGLRRQIRALSQGTPLSAARGIGMVAPSPAMGAAAASAPRSVATQAAATAAAVLGLRSAITPAPYSVGYADSHNPRTVGGGNGGGGTTGLLRHQGGNTTGHVGGMGGEGATTQLLGGDATMVSKSQHQMQQHMPQGSTFSDLSLGEFEQPPELPNDTNNNQMHQDQANTTPESGRHSQQQQQPPSMNNNFQGYNTIIPEVGEVTAELMNIPPGGPRLARTPLDGYGIPGPSHHHPMSLGGGGMMPPPPPGSILTGQLSYGPPGSVLSAPPLNSSVQKRRGSMVGAASVGILPPLPHVVPGSAIAARYPGARLSNHGLTTTTPMSMGMPMPQMTFQDFAKLMDVQFLDNLRRGASINYADIQQDPAPETLPDALRLLCITAPNVAEVENGLATLQHEVAARRVSAADGEASLGQMNPPIFAQAANAKPEMLESYKSRIGLLKKVCRLKAVALLKDVRVQMEESRAARLRRALEALQGDLTFSKSYLEYLGQVATTAEDFSQDAQKRAESIAHNKEAERARRAQLLSARQSLDLAHAANQQRRQVLADAEERKAKLKEEAEAAAKERTCLAAQVQALRGELFRRSEACAMADRSNASAALAKGDQLDSLLSCLGWEVESANAAAGSQASGEMKLLLQGGLFRMHLRIHANATLTGSILAADDISPVSIYRNTAGTKKISVEQRQFAAALAGGSFSSLGSGPAAMIASVQAAATRAARIADLVTKELSGLRLAMAPLCQLTPTADGRLILGFVNLDAGVKFNVELQLSRDYPCGDVLPSHQAKIWYDGAGQITEQQIAAAIKDAGEVPGRVRKICGKLSELAKSALPRPATMAMDGAGGGGGIESEEERAQRRFTMGFANPLFGNANRGRGNVPAPA